jgi:hypothetical protein
LPLEKVSAAEEALRLPHSPGEKLPGAQVLLPRRLSRKKTALVTNPARSAISPDGKKLRTQMPPFGGGEILRKTFGLKLRSIDGPIFKNTSLAHSMIAAGGSKSVFGAHR